MPNIHTDGRPHTTIRMGAGVYTLSATMGEKEVNLDLNKEPNRNMTAMAGLLCEFHGIKAKAHRAARRAGWNAKGPTTAAAHRKLVHTEMAMAG